MKVIAEVCIIPIGVGLSLSEYIAACQEILAQFELDVQLHANGTNIEGDWDVVFEALKKCHETVHGMGAPRIATTVRLGTRTDKDQSMSDKIESVQAKMSLASKRTVPGTAEN